MTRRKDPRDKMLKIIDGGSRKFVDLATYCRGFGKQCVDTLEGIMVSDDASDSDRIKAANAILDRGYGKAVQMVADAGGYEGMTDEELIETLRKFQNVG